MRAIEIVMLLTGAAFVLAVSLRDVVREWRRPMSQVKRMSVTLGQQLEVEYHRTPETKDFAEGVEVDRVFAYSGAVRVEVTALVREAALLTNIQSQCLEAEGLGPDIPF